ncbi:MAG: MFS transporter [Holophagales bacterium]|jgi:EmrB/QacA subfamily drug resistance transporter|nr:MFS transporter [Holophagales bacterium]
MTPDAGFSRRWEMLAFTCVGAFMAPLDGSITSVALPVIGQRLGLSFEGALWVQASYLLTMAVLLIPLGRLADQRGRLNFYLAGIALFTMGSIGAALSVGGASIILARVIQGSGGALLTSTSSALVIAVFPASERGRAMGINVMSVYAGLSLGPPLGGFLVDSLSWHWIFLINIPIGIAVLLWGRRLRKVTPETRTEGRVDMPGAILLGLAMITLLLPLTLHAKWGLTSAPALALFVLSAISFVAFVLGERSASEPLIDIKLLRYNPQFAFGNVAALLNYMALYAVALLTSVWLQLVQGLSATHAGWLMLGQPVVQSLLSPVAGRLSDHIGARALTAFGMTMTALGMSLLAYFGRGAALGAIVASLAVVGVGMASFSAPNSSSVMGSVERRQLGLAGAILGTIRVTGMALSVAILGGLAASHLGDGGWQALLKYGPGGPGAKAFIWGYRTAMLTGAGFAVIGTIVCLVKQKK